LLYQGITENEIGQLVLLDFPCGEMPFTLAKILEIESSDIQILPLITRTNDLDGFWNEAVNLKRCVPISLCFQKNIVLTKKNTLKKKIKTLLIRKYDFLG
jgi:hypothetical protein